MDEVLLLLLKRKAHAVPILISTTEMGAMLGMSQQNASRRLVELEKKGKIARTDGKLLVLKKGIDEALTEYGELKAVFEKGPSQLGLSGKIIGGLGEGKYYVQRYTRKIREKLGYVPYPGTLNLQLDEQSLVKRQQLQAIEPIIVDGFEESGRRYGGLFLYKCEVNGYPAAIIIPLRTHHGSEIVEIIAEKRLKEKLGKGKVRIKLLD